MRAPQRLEYLKQVNRSLSRFGKDDLLVFCERKVGHVGELKDAAENDALLVRVEADVAFHIAISSPSDLRRPATRRQRRNFHEP